MLLLNKFLGKKIDEEAFCNVSKGVVISQRDYVTYTLYAKRHGMKVNDLLNNALSLAAEELRKGK